MMFEKDNLVYLQNPENTGKSVYSGTLKMDKVELKSVSENLFDKMPLCGFLSLITSKLVTFSAMFYFS